MFFNNEDAAVKVIEVMHLKWQFRDILYHTAPRPYCALSYRKNAHTLFVMNGSTIEANRDSISFVPANVEYDRRSFGDDLIVIHFELFGTVPGEIEVFNPQISVEYERMFDEICSKWESKDIGYRFRCNGILNDIIYRVHKELYRLEPNETEDYVVHSARIIEKNISNCDFSLSSLSDTLGVSEAYLRMKFRQKYGMSPKQYQLSLRLERAKMLIRTGYYTVKQIASNCGFSDEKYFSTLFKKHFGVPPKHYL